MSNIYKGAYSYGEPLLRGDLSDVYVGNYTSIAQNVIVDCGFHHNKDFVSTFPFNVFFEEAKEITTHPKTKGDVFIGHDVWIGESVLIMGGIVIGDGAIIGANSVVTRNVLPYEIVAGNPAKSKSFRFDDKTIDELLKIKWWYWDIEKIKLNAKNLMSNNIQKFINENS